ncbi:MAG: branched-chain amino acid ABC transporter permease [Anaerolineae bacterium]|nr:branched-chain amino acid ABC transporter permease [Anaerolineae bacterium]
MTPPAPLSPRSWLWPLLLVGLVLIAYLYAAATGTPKAELTGLARLHSAAESVYCERGLNPVGRLLLIEIGLVAAAVVITQLWGQRWGRWGASLQLNGWYWLSFLMLIAMPFMLAWRTESSVCVRGRAFFWESILVELFIFAILAISYNLMFGFTGIVSFGHAAFFGLGAYTVGLTMLHWQWPWFLAVAAALLVGVLVALIKGFVGLRIKGLYFALFTLAFAEIFFILFANRIMVKITGAEDGFTFPVPSWLNFTTNRFFFYYLTLLTLAACFFLVFRLMNSPTGRVLRAIQNNEERAQMLGFNTFHYKLLVIVLAGVMAAAAGILRGIAFKGASPNVLGVGFTITPLLMTIIGGMGTFSGPVIGAFTLRLIEELLRDTVITIGDTPINIGERWSLILGLVFILSVMVFPYGIVGTWQSSRLRQWFRRRMTKDG